MPKIKVCLYLEFYHFAGGRLFKDIGTGLLSSYKNQKRMLEDLGIEYTERWDASADILQINTPWLYSLWLIRRARRLKMPVIIWAHVSAEDIRGVFWFGNLVSPLMKIYLKYAYDKADIILTPSPYTRELLSRYGIAREKIIAQSNGVDLKKFYKDAAKREKGRNELGLTGRAVGTVALAIPRKGIETFLNLASRFPAYRFIWAGKIYSGLLAKPLPKALPGNVRFTGYVDDILATYNAFDIFIFPSYEENEGMAILEAAAIGLPVVVRDIPAYEGWLVHGSNCLKAKTDEEFEACIERITQDPDLCERIGKGALALAQTSSLEALSAKFLETYKSLGI